LSCISHPVQAIRGALPAPGDKSCSHRALILAGIAQGESEISGLVDGEDVLRTGDAMAALGAVMHHDGPGQWRVEGVGEQGLGAPDRPLDFGNSGTGSRLVMGLLAGYGVRAALTGDESLCRRPMNRVLAPLREMGLRDTAEPDGCLPFTIEGSARARAIDYAPAQASAQVKSAILLAGLNAAGTTRVREARPTRDHTERMLRAFGARLDTQRLPDGTAVVSVEGGQRLRARDISIPGDPSSAAFLAAAAMISPGGDVLIERVMSNETRDGFFSLAQRMGVVIGAEETGEAAGERLIDLQVGHGGPVSGLHVPEALVPAMIDEFPILAVLAAFARGETRVTGAGELRVKETDRIRAVVDMLRVNGVDAEAHEDGFTVQGCGGPPPGGGHVETRHDHRIAMSALVMGSGARAPVRVDDISMIATSYPGFLADMAALGADIRPA